MAQLLSVFHKVTGSFSRTCLLSTQLWITSLSSVVLSSKNGDLWNNKRLVQLTTQSHKHSSMRQPLFFIMQQKCFTCTFHLLIQSSTKLGVYSEAEIYYSQSFIFASLRTFISETGIYFFFVCYLQGSLRMWLLGLFGACRCSHCGFSTFMNCFCNVSAVSTQWKRQKVFIL